MDWGSDVYQPSSSSPTHDPVIMSDLAIKGVVSQSSIHPINTNTGNTYFAHHAVNGNQITPNPVTISNSISVKHSCK